MDIRSPETKLNRITNDQCYAAQPHFGNADVMRSFDFITRIGLSIRIFGLLSQYIFEEWFFLEFCMYKKSLVKRLSLSFEQTLVRKSLQQNLPTIFQ